MLHPGSMCIPLHNMYTTTVLRYLRMSQQSNICIVSQLQESKNQQDKAHMQFQMVTLTVRVDTPSSSLIQPKVHTSQ